MPTNDIYEALAGWFLLLRELCNGHVNRTDISDVVDTVLGFELPQDDQPEYALGSEEEDQPPRPLIASSVATAPLITELEGQIGVLRIAL